MCASTNGKPVKGREYPCTNDILDVAKEKKLPKKKLDAKKAEAKKGEAHRADMLKAAALLQKLRAQKKHDEAKYPQARARMHHKHRSRPHQNVKLQPLQSCGRSRGSSYRSLLTTTTSQLRGSHLRSESIKSRTHRPKSQQKNSSAERRSSLPARYPARAGGSSRRVKIKRRNGCKSWNTRFRNRESNRVSHKARIAWMKKIVCVGMMILEARSCVGRFWL
jgi:hypothetical protein